MRKSQKRPHIHEALLRWYGTNKCLPSTADGGTSLSVSLFDLHAFFTVEHDSSWPKPTEKQTNTTSINQNMAIVAVLPNSQKRNEVSAALKTSSTTASSGSRWFKSLPEIRCQTSSKSQTVNVLLILNSRKGSKKSLFPLCSVISTALIASLVFVDKLGQLHCALRIQRRDLLTASQSKCNCIIFHKSPALFIFTSFKPTLQWIEQILEKQRLHRSKKKKSIYLLLWAAVATKSRSNSANFRRLKTN